MLFFRSKAPKIIFRSLSSMLPKNTSKEVNSIKFKAKHSEISQDKIIPSHLLRWLKMLWNMRPGFVF